MVIEQVKGIIFDMDNTLLRSKIDFSAMKDELYQYLKKQKLVPHDLTLDNHTCSTIIGIALQEGVSEFQDKQIWSIVQKHELKGMEGAGLEEGTLKLLENLHIQYTLVILTNNAQLAAEKALRDTGIYSFFESIVGREKMKELKPHPSGVEYILDLYPTISANQWLFIGDSWIDGKAAQGGGVPFVNYCGDSEEMAREGISPIARISRLEEIIGMLEALNQVG